MKLLTGMWEYVVCYRVGRNYHLCGNWAETSRMNLNNDWEKYSPEIYIQGRKKRRNACVQRGRKVAIEGVFFCCQKQPWV